MERNANNNTTNRKNNNRVLMLVACRVMQLVAGLMAPTVASADLVCNADFNRDGLVGSADLAALLSSWNTDAADLNGDSMTDSTDLSSLLAAWGSTCEANAPAPKEEEATPTFNGTDVDAIGADQNGDGQYDGTDLAYFANNWVEGDLDGDLNNDGAVDHSDYAIVRDATATANAEPTFAPDRRPVVVHRVWNGDYSFENQLGVSEQYRGDDAPQRMVEDLDRLYDEGWRRIWFVLPTGCRKADAMNGSLQEYKFRSQQWQDNMQFHVRQWADAHPDATIGIYMGLLNRDKVHPSERDVRRAMRFWMDAGFDEFAFDAASHTDVRPVFETAQRHLRKFGRRAVMEAFPVADGQAESEWTQKTPVMALSRFIDRKDPNRTWQFDASKTEAMIEIGRGSHIDEAELLNRLMQGYVPVVYSTAEGQRINALTVCEWFENQCELIRGEAALTF